MSICIGMKSYIVVLTDIKCKYIRGLFCKCVEIK